MAGYRITDVCDGCGECAASCPVEVISGSAERYDIGIGCNLCGCCAGVCPKGAIIRF